MNIILADDHAIFRDSLKFLLEAKTCHNVIAAIESIQALKQAVEAKLPDLIVVDYHMPEGNVLALTETLLKKYPQLKILFLTGTQSAFNLSHIIQSKVHGVCHKDDEVDVILSAINSVYRGEVILSDSIQRKAAKADIELSRREFQVFNLVVQGRSANESAELLNISARTLEKHKQNIMQKFEVNTVAQLIGVAHSLGVLSE